MTIEARLNTKRGKKILAKGNQRYAAAAPVEEPKARKPEPKPMPKPEPKIEKPVVAAVETSTVEEETEPKVTAKKRTRKPKAD